MRGWKGDLLDFTTVGRLIQPGGEPRSAHMGATSAEVSSKSLIRPYMGVGKGGEPLLTIYGVVLTQQHFAPLHQLADREATNQSATTKSLGVD